MVALDTNIYIYFLENNPEFFPSAEQAIKHALEAGSICVPTITLMEIRSGAPNTKEIIDFFANPQFEVHDFTIDLAIEAGQLRYEHKSLKSADSIHLATALANNVTQFITNDERLEKLKLDIEIIPLARFQ
ncbi:MAG TPA: type II toxin-antitoxin system VapC family toxin [Candidatus Saccharimonadales bacterium]|jgi:predicted nucleic acid-binding protein